MAKRPDYTPEKPYTPEQLSEIRRNFAMLSKASLQTALCGGVGTMQARQRWPTTESGAYPGVGAGVAAVEESEVNLGPGGNRPKAKCHFWSFGRLQKTRF